MSRVFQSAVAPFKANLPRLESYWAIEQKAFNALCADRFGADRANVSPQQASFTDRQGYPIRDGVALIEIEGVMTKQSWWPGDRGGMQQIEQEVMEAANDKAVNAILLRIDSPGGTVAGVSDLADAVYAARKTKPVYAYISDLGASAAYFVASQADRIYCDIDAIVGSIGVYLVIPDYSKMAEAEGITIHVVRAGEFKGAATGGTAVTDQQLSEFQREVNELNDVFVGSVARGRGWSTDRVRGLNDGRVHIGINAQQLGLVDGIKSFDQTMNELRSQSLGRSPRPMAWRQPAHSR